MANAYAYSNIAVANTIGNTGGISSSGTSLYCSTTPVGYPAFPGPPFKLVLNFGGSTEEIVKVTAGAGTSGSPWTIVRAWDGTTAAVHGAESVTHSITAEDEVLSRAHEQSGSGSGVHGLPSAAWLTSSVSTLYENTLVNSTTSLITISGISGSYSNLILVAQGRFTETTQQSDDVYVTLNGDTSSHYSYVTIHTTNISGSGVGALVGGQFSGYAGASWPMFRFAANQAGSTANAGGGFAFLPNYTGTAFNKMFYSLSGAGDGSTAMVDMRIRAGWWNPASQAAISTIALTAPAGTYFLTGSYFALYGLS